MLAHDRADELRAGQAIHGDSGFCLQQADAGDDFIRDEEAVIFRGSAQAGALRVGNLRFFGSKSRDAYGGVERHSRFLVADQKGSAIGDGQGSEDDACGIPDGNLGVIRIYYCCETFVSDWKKHHAEFKHI
jgi:hypothetical protein